MKFKKIFEEINGLKQGMIICEANEKISEKPVILYMHGGPGEAKYPVFEGMGLDLKMKEFFTTCFHDQRGAGISYSPDAFEKNFTLEQFVEDAAEVARYLIKTYKKEKIYLVGHSWGTMLGTHTVKKYPELFHAYIGLGQMGNQFLAEAETHNYFVQKAYEEREQNPDLLNTLLNWDRSTEAYSSLGWLLVRNECLGKWHVGFSHTNPDGDKTNSEFFSKSKVWDDKEKSTYQIGVVESISRLWPRVISEGNTTIDSVDIPVHIMQGVYDFQTAYPQSLAYYLQLKAPFKEFIQFDNSAHSLMYDEPDKFLDVLKRVVTKN